MANISLRLVGFGEKILPLSFILLYFVIRSRHEDFLLVVILVWIEQLLTEERLCDQVRPRGYQWLMWNEVR